MKNTIKLLSVALLVASTTQVFAADDGGAPRRKAVRAAFDPAAFLAHAEAVFAAPGVVAQTSGKRAAFLPLAPEVVAPAPVLVALPVVLSPLEAQVQILGQRLGEAQQLVTQLYTAADAAGKKSISLPAFGLKGALEGFNMGPLGTRGEKENLIKRLTGLNNLSQRISIIGLHQEKDLQLLAGNLYGKFQEAIAAANALKNLG